MFEYYLHCNVIKCRKELKTQAWVTSCSHIYCLEHGQQSCEKQKCLACEYSFSNRYDIIMMDLNPSEEYKNMVIAGLNPEKIYDIANRALTLWSYQIYQERLYYESALRNSKQQSASVADYCETVAAKHKVEIQKAQRTIEELKSVVDEKNKKLDDLVVQLSEKARLIKNLQGQNDNLKRRYLVNTSNIPANEPFDNSKCKANNNCQPDGKPYFKHKMGIGENLNESNNLFQFNKTPKRSHQQEEFIFQPIITELGGTKQQMFGNYKD